MSKRHRRLPSGLIDVEHQLLGHLSAALRALELVLSDPTPLSPQQHHFLRLAIWHSSHVVRLMGDLQGAPQETPAGEPGLWWTEAGA